MPSGMVTSAQNTAWSVPPVIGVEGGVLVPAGSSPEPVSDVADGVEDISPVSCCVGEVVVVGLASSVSCALAVSAAAVSTASGSGVGLASPSAEEQAARSRHRANHRIRNFDLIIMVIITAPFRSARNPIQPGH